NINYNKLTDIDKEEIIPFNWDKINGGNLFDVIIGNPPYVTTEDIKNLINKKEVKVYKNRYSTSKGQYDKYFIFVERALQKIKQEGYLSYIIPNKFTKIKSGEAIRDLLSKNKYVKEYIDFGSEQIFKRSNKTVYSSILLLQKKYQKNFKYIEVDNISKWFSKTAKKEIVISTDVLGKLPWALVTNSDDMKLINQMYRNAIPLSEEAYIFNGIQTSAERPPIYWFSEKEVIEETDKLFKIKKFDEEFLIEKSILKKYFKPVLKSEKNLGSYDVYSTDKYIIFPYNSNGVLYDIDIMKNKYPNTLNYLEFNYDKLKPKQIDSNGRRDVPLAKKDTWYQYGRDQALTAFNNRKKLIVGVLAKKAMYLYDDKDLVI
ncbi:TPA: class I SAM-dependent DNA methyltransferase, partial [Clostridioides difficile]|nr:class I SAM-dependent DNA methyltransferase [Clostridioides difficile]